jgi:hypothetical protein
MSTTVTVIGVTALVLGIVVVMFGLTASGRVHPLGPRAR